MAKRGLAMMAAAAMVLPGVAAAEVVQITGEFPAQYREASFLRSIAVERIAGQDGPVMALALERALAIPDDDGTVYFEVLAGRTGRNAADGGISGVVTTDVQESRYTRKDKKCVERDANKKCVKEEETETPCRRRVIGVNADLRIVRNSDGRIVYSTSRPFRDETSWCAGENPNRSTETAISDMIHGLAGGLRDQIAPDVRTYRIRVRESTKGLPKDAAKQFKALVKQSQRDLRGACAGWQAMNQANPGHASVVFDLGLCAEQRGDYEGAATLYQEAYRLIGGDGDEARVGLDRARQLIAGRADAAERGRR